jgi:hypothetical protein
MDASKVTIGEKTYDLQFLDKKKKTNLRRRLVIEYIQSKPAGEYIKMRELQEAAKLSTTPNANAFIKRMIRDGVIMRHNGEKPKSFYYSVIGTVRVKTPKQILEQLPKPGGSTPDINGFVADMQKLGVQFTITISNKKEG